MHRRAGATLGEREGAGSGRGGGTLTATGGASFVASHSSQRATRIAAFKAYARIWPDQGPTWTLDAVGMSKAARQSGLSRESFYKALGEDGNPSLDTILRVARAVGVRFRASAA